MLECAVGVCVETEGGRPVGEFVGSCAFAVPCVQVSSLGRRQMRSLSPRVSGHGCKVTLDI
jgi:hypothetical protein